jgi:hypothetical protein
LTPDSSPYEVEIAVATLKIYKLPCSSNRSAELIQPGFEILLSLIHKLINYLEYGRIA